MVNQLQRKLLEMSGNSGSISSYTRKDWSSITFTGDKFQFCLLFTDKEDADRFKDQIEKVEINLIGSMVAGVYIVEDDELPALGHTAVTVEVVTLNEA